MSCLAQKAKLAVIWNAGFNLFRDILQFGVMIVLVRLLPPEAYGQSGMVTSVVGFIAIFSFNQFVAHTLQVRDENELNYQLHFTAGGLINLGMFVVTNLVAITLRYSETYAPVAPLVHTVSMTFLLEWPCEFRRKMIEREFDWKRLRLLHALGLMGSSALAITMACAGAGVYALVLPGLTVTLPFIFDLFVTRRWRPTWEWSPARYRTALRFGLTRAGSGLAVNGRQLAESAAVVKVLGFASLGLLNRALGLAQMFCSRFATQLMYAIYPLLTRLDAGHDNISRVSGLVLRIVAWTVVPMAILFSALAEPLVATVYGRQWVEVTPLLPWAMIFGATSALAYTMNFLLLSQQQPKRCFTIDLLNLLSTGASLVVLLPIGLQFHLLGMAILNALLATIMSFWLVRMDALKVAGIAQAILPALAASTGSLFMCEMCRQSFYTQPMGLVSCICYGLLFGLTYLAILRISSVRYLAELLHYMPARGYVQKFLLLATE